MKKTLENCPCCHLPTLGERAGYDICIVCWWEDDGQDDRNANVVFGGPNGSYSLTDARQNYAKHGHMYAEGDGISVVETPSKARRDLMSYLKRVAAEGETLDLEKFYQQLGDAER